MATAVLLLLQAPPGVASLNERPDPAHSEEAPPVMAPGMPVTVISTVLYEPDTEYVMVAVPAAAPVTTPLDEPMVATPVLPLVQVPPADGSVSVTVAPWQTNANPAIGAGAPITVTVTVL